MSSDNGNIRLRNYTQKFHGLEIIKYDVSSRGDLLYVRRPGRQCPHLSYLVLKMPSRLI
jgi:hypothetical protein